jgi:hypothetical protein
MRHVLLGSILGALLIAGTAGAQEIQLLSPDITFTAQEVFFRDPVTYLGPDGSVRTATSALKLLLRGEDFYDGSTGPFYYLGERKADAHYTSPDGEWVAVYFYEPEVVPRRARFRIETRIGKFVTLRQPFEVEKVQWLAPQIREQHDLPDLRARVAVRPGG